jgi:hypothetical protein
MILLPQPPMLGYYSWGINIPSFCLHVLLPLCLWQVILHLRVSVSYSVK